MRAALLLLLVPCACVTQQVVVTIDPASLPATHTADALDAYPPVYVGHRRTVSLGTLGAPPAAPSLAPLVGTSRGGSYTVVPARTFAAASAPPPAAAEVPVARAQAPAIDRSVATPPVVFDHVGVSAQWASVALAWSSPRAPVGFAAPRWQAPVTGCCVASPAAAPVAVAQPTPVAAPLVVSNPAASPSVALAQPAPTSLSFR